MGHGREPATKADLNALEDKLSELIRDTETKLLRAYRQDVLSPGFFLTSSW